MCAAITFTWDSRDLAVWRGGRVEKALETAMKRAGNEALRAMKAASTRSVRQRKRVRVARVNKGLPLTYPKTSALASLAWRMDVSGAAVPLADYPSRQTRKGVSVAVNNGKRKVVKSAFLATMTSGHQGVFVRTGKSRLPIKELFSTTIADVFGDDGMIPAVQNRAQSVFASAFERLFALELAKVK